MLQCIMCQRFSIGFGSKDWVPTHTGHMRPGIVMYQEEPRAYYISISFDNGSEDFMLLLNSSRFSLASTWATLQGYYFPDHHLPTDKLVMLNDVEGSISFNYRITRHICEPALVREENRVPLSDLSILGFSGKCQWSCMVLACENRCH